MKEKNQKKPNIPNIPNILVISNNVFSNSSNNGKTLASFFSNFPASSISQLYFSNEQPEDIRYFNYYRITDKEIAQNLFIKKEKTGNIVNYNFSNNKEKIKKNQKVINIDKLKKTDLARVFREIIWKKSSWRSFTLDNWIEQVQPDIIFFCAGDSGFAYDITEYVLSVTKAKLVTYITDDYILPRKYNHSPFSEYRRKFINKKMKKTINNSDLFMTISNEMKNEYKKIFGKDSTLAINMANLPSIDKINVHSYKPDKCINLVYTGGLHLNRFKNLELLAQSIKVYNGKTKGKKAFLNIYSSNEPSKEVLKSISIQDVSSYRGSLYGDELTEVLINSDILVHVESFDKKSMESTKLSISTKIPEYLSFNKPILAIGPGVVASMKYLKDCAFCITEKHNIQSEIKNLLNNENDVQNNLAKLAFSKYQKNHDKDIVNKKFFEQMVSLLNK